MSHNSNQIGFGGHYHQRHSTTPSSTKANKHSTQSQFAQNLNMQQIMTSKEVCANYYKNQQSQQTQQRLQHLANNKPPSGTDMPPSQSSTPQTTTLQQRALTQLYQQSQQPAPLAPTVSSAKHSSSSAAKNYWMLNHHQVASAKGGGSNSGTHKDKGASAAAGASSQSTSHAALKNADLQAKFATLLRSSKDKSKDHVSSAKGQASKQDKKGEKRDAAAARTQLFGENNTSHSKKNDSAKHVRETGSTRPSQVSPSRGQASATTTQNNLRQTPVNQQMLIIQNQGGSPKGAARQNYQTQAMKTLQAQGVPVQNTNAGVHAQKSQLSGVSSFPRQASQTIPSSSELRDGLLLAQQRSGHQMAEHTASGQVLPQGRESSAIRASQPVRSSNSQTRTKKKSRAHQNTSAVYRTSQPVINSHDSGPVQSSLTQTAAFLTEGQAQRVMTGPQQHRASNVTTATNNSTKSKKKKQQPSQQQTNAADAVEEYLANAARMQQQMQQLNNIPATATTSNTNLVNSQSQPQVFNTLQPRQDDNNESSDAAAELPGSVAAALLSTGISHLNHQQHSQSTNTLGIHANQPSQQLTNQAQLDQPIAPSQQLEQQMLASFKAKCQHEMQLQTKQAVAKLLYTKREVLMEIKALQASLKQSIPQNQPPAESSASKAIVQASLNEAKNEIMTKVDEMLQNYTTQQQLQNELVSAQEAQQNAQAMQGQRLEERIDEILVQIQHIVSGMEDSIYSRLDSLEEDQAKIYRELEAIREEDQSAKAHQLASQGLEHLRSLEKQCRSQMASTENFRDELDKLRKDVEEKVVEMPKFMDKNTDDFPLTETQLAQVNEKIASVQDQMGELCQENRLQLIKDQEVRFDAFQDEVSQLVVETLDRAQQDFQRLQVQVKDDVHSYIKKELLAKEATFENKIEKNKQQFLKAINGNMRILDNLISDYTTRTHDQIKKQLQTGPSSRTHQSNRLHLSNHDGETEDIQSIHGSSLSGRSHPYQTHASSNNPLQLRNVDNAATGQSLHMVGSLSSVQDVSDSKQADEDNLSSALLSTARDRLLQQEHQNQLTGTLQATQTYDGKMRVPQLNIHQMVPQVKQSSNSERLNMPPLPISSNAYIKENNQNTSGISANNKNESAHSNGNLLDDQQDDYSTPQKVTPDKLPQGRSSSVRTDQKAQATQASPQMIIVEEQKFNQSSNEDMLPRHETEAAVTGQPMIVNSHQRRQTQALPNTSQTFLAREEVSANRLQVEHSDQDSDGHESEPSLTQACVVTDQAQHKEEIKNNEDLRQMMEGDLQERSMDQIPPLKQTDMRKNFSDKVLFTAVETANGDFRFRNVNVMQLQQQQSDQDQINEEEVIDFALSNSPYNMKSGGAPIGNSQDSNSISGTIYNFGFNSMQSHQVQQSRSQSLKQPSQRNDQGAFSSRLNQVVSPVQASQYGNNQGMYRTGTSTYKQENTDSDFFNLTAEEESQIDPVLVMRNLSNTILGSGTTSMIQIQEADNNTTQQKSGNPATVNTQRQSFHSYVNDGQIHIDESQNGAACNGPSKAYQLLQIEQLPSNEISSHNPAILTDEAVEVQLIQNDGRRLRGEDPNIQEFTPVATSPMDMQRSFQNSEENDHGVKHSHSGSKVQMAKAGSFGESDLAELVKKQRTKTMQEKSQTRINAPQGEYFAMVGSQDQNDDAQVSNGDEHSYSNSQSQSNINLKTLTKGQARRSKMVPMMEERQPFESPTTSKALLMGDFEQRMEQETFDASKRLSQVPPRLNKTASSSLPSGLQKQGNEIMQDLFLNEVFAALDEVIGLGGDKLRNFIQTAQVSQTSATGPDDPDYLHFSQSELSP